MTEGTDTEPAYFGAIRDRINACYRGRIQLEIFGEGDNTLSLLNKARNRVFANPNGYKHVWVVYDTDDFPVEHIDQTAHLCKIWSTEDTTYHAIWSNQCIELWFLLHFSYIHSKNRQDMYKIHHPMMDRAIANAKRLASENRDKPPSQSAPGTKVHEFIEILKPYLSE